MAQEVAEMDAAQKKLEYREKVLAELAKPVPPKESTRIIFVTFEQETQHETKKDTNLQLGLF